MQAVLPHGPPGHHRAIDALAHPGDEVAKPYRGRLETFDLSPTQPMKVMRIIVFVVPDKEIVVADTLSAIILRDIPQIVIESIRIHHKYPFRMRCRISLREQSRPLYCAKDMSNLATLMRGQILGGLLAFSDDGCTPPARIVGPICPGFHALPELRMIGIGYGCNTAITPLGFDLLRKPAVKGIDSRLAILAVMVKTLKKIFDWWVFRLIAD